MKIKIGTRKSKLAMIQTEMTAKALQSKFPDIKIEIIPVSTKGDMILDKPLSMIGGKGIFVSEIERMLENKEILYSYGYPILENTNGKITINTNIYKWDSQTTLRHIKEYLQQIGYPKMTKKELIEKFC